MKSCDDRICGMPACVIVVGKYDTCTMLYRVPVGFSILSEVIVGCIVRFSLDHAELQNSAGISEFPQQVTVT